MKLSMIWTLCALAVIIIILDTAKAEANRRPKQRPQSHRRPRPHRKPHNKHRPRRPHKGPQTHHLVYTSEALDELYGGNGPTGDITSNYSPQTQSDIVEDDFKVPNFFNDIRQQYNPTEHQQPQTYNKPETSYRLPNTSYKQPETSYKQPETSYKQPEKSYKQQETSYKQPETSYKQPETSYKQPETSYKQPETSYKQQETSYKQPETSYKQPETSYKQPETSYKQPETSYKQPDTSYKQPETSYKQPETSYKSPNKVNTYGSNSADSQSDYRKNGVLYKDDTAPTQSEDSAYNEPATGDMFDFSFPTFESLKTSFINKMRELQTSHGYTGTIDNSEARPIDAGIVDDHSSTASQVHETVSTVAATPPPTYRAASASHLVQISVHGGVFQSTPATTPHYQSEGDNSPLLELSSTVYENQQRQSAEFPTDRDRHVIHTDVGEKQGEARDYLDQSVFPTNQHPVDMQLNSNHTITATAISSHRRRDDMKSHRVNASRVYEHQLRSHSNIDDSNDRYDTASGMSNENSIILAPSSSLGTPGRTSDADTETISVQATDASIFRNKYPPHNDNYYPPTYSPHTVTASSRRHEGNSLVSASEGVSEGAAVVTHPRSSLLSVYSTPPRSLYADYPDYDTPKPSSIRRQP